MLDARTIEALQGLPAADASLSLDTELAAVPHPDQTGGRGKAYVNALLLSLPDKRKRQAELIQAWENNAIEMGRAIASISSEDFVEAKVELDKTVEEQDKRLQETMRLNSRVLKSMERNKKRAVNAFPEYKLDIAMIFSEVERLQTELCESIVDYNAVVRSFAARFDEDADAGESFQDTESLEKYLKTV